VTTADRCAALCRDLRTHLHPEADARDAAVAILADGLVQIARQGYAGPMAESLLAHALEEVAP
jgi:hypothetical protein